MRRQGKRAGVGAASLGRRQRGVSSAYANHRPIFELEFSMGLD